MAIKIQCSNCGFENDLGRVFCTQCGQKLDLRATAMSDLNERREFDFVKLFRRLLMVGVVLTGVTIIGLAAWTPAIPPVRSDPAGASQVPIKAKAIRAALSFNKPVSLDFSEAEINGFMAERAKARKIKSLLIDLKPGSFVLYASLNWGPGERVPVTLSMSGSFQGGVMIVGQCCIGRLPLPGPAKKAVVDTFGTLFSDITAEERIVSCLKSVALEETRADLMLGP